MNILYSILTSRLATVSGYYAKRRSDVLVTPRMTSIMDMLLGAVPNESLCMFACAVCRIAVSSVFRTEILALDPRNTYGPAGRSPEAADGDTSYCMRQLMLPASGMRPVTGMLDQDIKARLVVPSWPEAVSAVCLQLLREAV